MPASLIFSLKTGLKCTKTQPRGPRKVGERIHCFNCQCVAIKYGTSKTGIQRYKCSSCQKTFQQSYTYNAYAINTDNSIKEHIKEGCGIRSVARLLKISKTTVLKRILSISKTIFKPLMAMGKDYEMDELCTFIKTKTNQRWIAYAIRRDTREVVDFTIGARTINTLKRIMEKLIVSHARKVYTDRLLNFYRYRPTHSRVMCDKANYYPLSLTASTGFSEMIC